METSGAINPQTIVRAPVWVKFVRLMTRNSIVEKTNNVMGKIIRTPSAMLIKHLVLPAAILLSAM